MTRTSGPRARPSKGGFDFRPRISCGSSGPGIPDRSRSSWQSAEGRLRGALRRQDRGCKGREGVPTVRSGCPEETKSQEGRGVRMGFTVHRRPSHSSWGAKPWRRRRASWRGFGHRSARRNGRRAEGRGEPGTAPRRGQIPEGRTLDVVAGRNKLARHVVEQAVEGGWNAEDGT